jgi:hypothetical protein
MEWINSNWWWIIVVLMVLAGGARFAFCKWRETREAGEASGQILDLVEAVLKSLHKVFESGVYKVDQTHVINAARDVYRRFIAPTSLSKFVSEDEFTQAVLEAWQEVAGIEKVVALAVTQTPPP